MIVNMQFFRKFILSILLVLSIFSEILFFNSNFGPVSYILAFSLPLFFLTLFLYKTFIISRFLFPVYVYILLLLIYSILGAIYFGQIGLLAQIHSFFIMPLIFIHLGFFIDKRVAINIVVFLVLICLFFALSQFFYYTYNTKGPFNIFIILSDFSLANQLAILPNATYGRATGIFVNPNTLGFFGGLTYWLISYIQKDKISWKAYIGIFSSLLCVFLSFSRTSLIGLFFSITLVYALNFVMHSYKIKSLVKHTILVSVLIFSLYFLAFYINDYQFQRFKEISSVASSGVEQSANLSGRLNAWSTIFDYTKNNPLGTIVPPQLVIQESPDNQFIYFFAQGGYLLLIATLMIYIYLIYQALRYGRSYHFAFLGGCIFVLISSVTLVALNIFVISLFWLMIGMHARSRVSRSLLIGS